MRCLRGYKTMESNILNYASNDSLSTTQILADARNLGYPATSLDSGVRSFLDAHREDWFKLQQSRPAGHSALRRKLEGK